MSQFVRIARRNEQSAAALFETLQIDRTARRHHDFSSNLRFSDESIEIVFIDRGIDPRIELCEVRGWIIEQQPVDVLSSAMETRHRLLDQRDDRASAKRGDGVQRRTGS